jgi:hypothetical protein
LDEIPQSVSPVKKKLRGIRRLLRRGADCGERGRGGERRGAEDVGRGCACCDFHFKTPV